MLYFDFCENCLYICETGEDNEHLKNALEIMNLMKSTIPNITLEDYSQHQPIICRDIGYEFPKKVYGKVYYNNENNLQTIANLTPEYFKYLSEY